MDRVETEEELGAGESWTRSRATRLLQWALILVVSVTLVSLHEKAYPKISPIDELQHIDYLFQVTHFHLIHTGQHVSQQAMQAEACRGADLAGFKFPPCGSRLTPSEFPGRGYSTADIHPPGYYVTTALVARAMQASGITSSFVTAARLVGGLWLGAGLIVLFELLALVAVPQLLAWAIVAFLVSAPEIVYSSSIVNPDATGILAGSLVLLAVVQWERRRWPTIALGVVAAGVALLKSSWLLAIIAACLYLLRGALPFFFRRMRAFESRRRTTEYIGAIGLLGALSLGAQGAWLLYRRATALTSGSKVPVAEMFHVNSLSLHDLGSQLFSLILPTDRSYSPVLDPHLGVHLGMQVFDIVFTVGLLAAFFVSRGEDSLSATRWLGGATFGAFPLGSMFLVVGTFLSSSDFVPLPARYGIALLPFIAFVTARSMQNRWAAAGVVALSAGTLTATVVQLVAAARI